MSGVSRLVLKDNKGLAQPTNETLKEEGIAGRDKDDK